MEKNEDKKSILLIRVDWDTTDISVERSLDCNIFDLISTGTALAKKYFVGVGWGGRGCKGAGNLNSPVVH